MASAELSSPRLTLDPRLVDLLRRRLPEVATHTIAAVTDEVPSYAGAFGGPMGDNIENAVQMALAGFLRVAARGRTADAGTPLSPALEGAYALGRGEARSGRSADALLSAYRVGARVAWRELSDTAVSGGIPASTLASFAELVFAYIDELSAASVAGHADELDTSGRVRQRYLDRLAAGLLRGDPADALVSAAERADWLPPKTMTAVILPGAQVRPVQGLLDPRTLVSLGDAVGLPEGLGVLLVPDAGGRARSQLVQSLAGRSAVAGPARPWLATGYVVHPGAARARPCGAARRRTTPRSTSPTSSSPPTRRPWPTCGRRRSPRSRSSRPRAGEKLTETLRAWLLHQGRRDDIAAALFVHPQTVRYRMGQLRELYGARLEDPDTIRDLTIALS